MRGRIPDLLQGLQCPPTTPPKQTVVVRWTVGLARLVVAVIRSRSKVKLELVDVRLSRVLVLPWRRLRGSNEPDNKQISEDRLTDVTTISSTNE